MKEAQPHAQGWSAECPYCEEIDEVSGECRSPEGDTVECTNKACGKEFKLGVPYL
jgi:hypothetical protein